MKQINAASAWKINLHAIYCKKRRVVSAKIEQFGVEGRGKLTESGIAHTCNRTFVYFQFTFGLCVNVKVLFSVFFSWLRLPSLCVLSLSHAHSSNKSRPAKSHRVNTKLLPLLCCNKLCSPTAIKTKQNWNTEQNSDYIFVGFVTGLTIPLPYSRIANSSCFASLFLLRLECS